MNIKYLSVDEIRPYKKNAKKHDEAQVNAVAKSIQDYGFQQPIVVDAKNVIVIGHCRYEAAKKLGIEKIPVVVKDDLTDEEIKALRIVDNKTNESAWDTKALAEEISGLPDVDFSDFGFGNFELMTLKSFGKQELEEAEQDFIPITSRETERQTEQERPERAYGAASENGVENAPINTNYDYEDEEDGEEIGQPIEQTERHIFIMHSDEEIEWFKQRLGIGDELQPSYRIKDLMEEKQNEDR